MRHVALFLLLLLASPEDAFSQLGRVIHRSPRDTLLSSYRLYDPVGMPVGLLVLLPGGGGTHDAFNPGGPTPSTLPRRLAATVATIVPAEVDWLNDRWLEQLDAVIAETLTTYRLPRHRVVVGGFSGGGTVAISYAEFTAAGRSRAGVRVRGAFAADAPLDMARLWRGEALAIARGADARFVAEAKMVLGLLEKALGGAPEQNAARYLEASPLSAFAKGGGQAALLRDVAVRLYTEPDVDWWMANRQLDYYSMNAVDAAALVTQLQLMGNKEAELVTTHNRGFRPGGARHPHSWSIIDEENLADWIRARLST
jgi:pimeloyl-ACP methyl ester carboxylesterase